MIDAATVERYMRDANPLPNLDDINADEFARFVAAAHPRRAVIMQAPTQHPTEPTPTTPKRRSRRVWAFAAAFIIVLVGVGLAALLLSSEEQPVVDEPPFDIESLRWTRVPHNPAVFGGAKMDRIEVTLLGVRHGAEPVVPRACRDWHNRSTPSSGFTVGSERHLGTSNVRLPSPRIRVLLLWRTDSRPGSVL